MSGTCRRPPLWRNQAFRRFEACRRAWENDLGMVVVCDSKVIIPSCYSSYCYFNTMKSDNELLPLVTMAAVETGSRGSVTSKW
jgi:hypothetical protein